MAERIAEELEVDLGGVIGYQVRFTDQSSDDTLVKVMTDGILLNEMQRDRMLRRYDTIIIDEAHERSLNIDFILGYLKQLLPRRPDLKVVVTSATIDPERFAEHFAAADGTPAPIIEVSGRTYPVEVRYRPLVDPDRPDGEERDQVTGVVRRGRGAVDRARRRATSSSSCRGSGRSVTRPTRSTSMDLPQTEVLPLYARLSAAEQHRVFGRASGRRIVLATNVAETSLTVPGIRYVVDAGTARISRYSQRTKVQRLPIEPISQASANQRAGRCGRVADGICIRLYSEEDYDARPEFTEPEIQRTSLASVILQMTAAGPRRHRRPSPSSTPPTRARWPTVCACSRSSRPSTPVTPATAPAGRRRGRAADGSPPTDGRWPGCPVDPRLGRMLIEAGRAGLHARGARHRRRAVDAGPARAPGRQADPGRPVARAVPRRALRLPVPAQPLGLPQGAAEGVEPQRVPPHVPIEYLHYLRVREWQDLHSQLRKACQDLDIDPRQATAAPGEAPDADLVHQALLAGLLSHIGLRDEAKRDYLGARGARFGISPGSTLFRRQPTWVMAAELVETTRLWARTTARIDPVWAERLAPHLVKRTYSEPRWSRKQGAAQATERVTLYGVPLVAARTVSYAKVNPEESRDLFIRHALVEGDWDTHHEFWRANQALLRRLSELEERARRRDILVDDEDLVAFYDARVPGRRRLPAPLRRVVEGCAARDAPPADLHRGAADPRLGRRGVRRRLPPELARRAASSSPSPTSSSRGRPPTASPCTSPCRCSTRCATTGFDWQVPGLRADLATALIRALPKATRRHFVPAPDHAVAALADARPGGGRRLTEELGRVLRARTGTTVPEDEWAPDRVPDHLRVTFSVEDGRGRVLGSGKDLAALQEQLAGQVQQRMSRAGATVERQGLRQWDFGELPTTFETSSGGQTVHGYPALVDRGDPRRPRRAGRAAGGRGGDGPRRAPAAAAQHHRALEAGAGPADQRPEAQPRRQPARLGARPARGLPRLPPSTPSSAERASAGGGRWSGTPRPSRRCWRRCVRTSRPGCCRWWTRSSRC